MLMLMALIVIWKRIPVFYDHFSVREELRLVFYCAMLYYGSVIIFFIAIFSTQHAPTISTIFVIIHGFFALLSQTLIIVIQTGWVLRKIRPYLHIQNRLSKSKSKLVIADLNKEARAMDEENYIEQAIIENQEQRSLGVTSVTEDKEADAEAYQKMQEDFTVNDLIEHPVGFDAFMMHLIREFSMEC